MPPGGYRFLWRRTARAAVAKVTARARRPVDDNTHIGHLFAGAVHASADAISIGRLDASGSYAFIYVNPAYEALTGYVLAELRAFSGAELAERLLKGPAFFELTERARVAGRAEGRIPGRHKSGMRFQRNVALTVLPAPGEGATYVVSVSADSSAAEKIAETLRLQARAIEASQNGLMIARAGGRENPIVLVNRAFEKITGYGADEVIGRDARFLQGTAVNQPEIEEVRRALAEGTSLSVVLENYRKDGAMFWNELHIDPVRDERGHITHFIGVINDVTQQRESAARLQQMQKLKAIGHLTGGIAHDFNNLLTVIIGNLRLMEGDLQDPAQQRRLRLALSAAGRGADLTKRLSAYSRTQRLKEEAVQLNELVREFEPLLGRTLGEHMRLKLVLASGLWDVNIDRSQLESALLNLIINARDAMPEGGDITITTANCSIDASAADPELAAGDYVLVTVTDTGVGMPKEIRDRAFEPFFTTKEVGKGTGLGLSSVYGFVKQSGGHVTIYSEVGIGTSVKLFLPRALQAVEAAAVPPPDGIAERGRGERLLLVEDDPEVRGTTAAILRQNGYEVVEATTAEDALAVLARRRDIALVLSDIVMPGRMNGYDLMNALRRLRPRLPVLLTSGYPRDAVPRRLSREFGVTIIPKPFHVNELMNHLRRQLETRLPEAAATSQTLEHEDENSPVFAAD